MCKTMEELAYNRTMLELKYGYITSESLSDILIIVQCLN